MHIAVLFSLKKIIFEHFNQHVIDSTGIVYLQYKTFVLSSLFVARSRTAY